MNAQGSSGGPIRGKAHEALPFSRFVLAGDTVHVSGIVGRDPVSRELKQGDLVDQTRVALQVIRQILQDAGACLADVVKAMIFLTNMSNYDDVNRAYREAFAGALPSRTCVEVKRLPDPEAQVEIEVLVYHPGSE